MLDWLRDRYYRWKYGWPRPRPAAWEEAARRRGLFPAYADLGGGIALDRAGEVWYSEEPEVWSDPYVLDQPELRFAALGVALRRYPELAALAPRREATDPECPTCKGRGYAADLPPHLRYLILCECGGMGWLPARVAAMHREGVAGSESSPPAV